MFCVAAFEAAFAVRFVAGAVPGEMSGLEAVEACGQSNPLLWLALGVADLNRLLLKKPLCGVFRDRGKAEPTAFTHARTVDGYARVFRQTHG